MRQMRPDVAPFKRLRIGRWRLWLDPTRWRDQWWDSIERALMEGDRGRRSRHASTFAVSLNASGDACRAFLKVYPGPNLWRALKQWLQGSMAWRALRMTQELSACGFRVPAILGAGEMRRGGLLRKSFLLAEAVEGVELTEVASRLASSPRSERVAQKRRLARLIGSEVGRLHRLGYVHGDLVVTNILVKDGGSSAIWLIDHDRSRGPVRFFRGYYQRRNLIQLNRVELAGVTHCDRLRTFRHYAAARGWSKRKVRVEARRIAARTKARREQVARAIRRKEASRASESEARMLET